MVILGIDPGYAIVGYGVLEFEKNNFKLITYGAVTTEAGPPFSKRLEQVYAGIGAIMDTYHPDAISMEQLFFTTNQKTGIMVAEARGVTLLAAIHRNIPVFEYTPLQVKSAVTGYGKATKHQVMEMTKSILKLEAVPKPDDAADAVAMAICHGHSSGSLLGKSALELAIEKAELKEARQRARKEIAKR